MSSTPRKRPSKAEPSSSAKRQSSLLSFFSKVEKTALPQLTDKQAPSPPVEENRKVNPFISSGGIEENVQEDLPTPISSNSLNEESDEETISVRKKRKVVVSSDDEYEPQSIEKEEDEEVENEEVKDKAQPTEKEKEPISKKKPQVKTKKLLEFDAGVQGGGRSPSKVIKKSFSQNNEERYKWLIDIKDADGRCENDPEYDPRTLYVPSSAWTKFTPFEKQYWEVKSKMWDSVVFFKKGKFYELYEKDADIAHNQFDLKLAGGGRANMRLAGIPEMSFDYWASSFINAGYKVAKVDQKESLLAKSIREKGKIVTKEEKVIRRELEAVLTGGTLTDEAMLTDDMATYCLAIKQRENTFGICFVDTATGSMRLAEFEDDLECSRLETLLAQVRPKEILVEKSRLSGVAMKILKYNASAQAIWNHLKENEFWDADITFENLTRGKYFPAENLDDLQKYPSDLVLYHEHHPIGFSAFGALLWYLTSLKLDQSIVSMGDIKHYEATQSATSCVLDGVTLQNLEVFASTFDGSDRGTLFKLLNRATTPMGKRMLRTWIMHPLLHKKDIESRLDSVDALLNDSQLLDHIERFLSKIPDLERMLSRIHSKTLKLKDFVKVIESFEHTAELVQSLGSYSADLVGGSLHKFLGQFPKELDAVLSNWTNAFDRELALNGGVMVPEGGVEPEFDESIDTTKKLENSLESLLRQYRKEFKCQEMCFKDSGKEVYLIETPAKLKVPHDWQQMGSTSKVKRYWSPAVRETVQELLEAREIHKMLQGSLQQKMYAKFDTDSSVWFQCVKSISSIDCLVSLAKASHSLGEPSCRPQFIDSSHASVDFKELRHPCFIPGGASGTSDFIPNDVVLGSASPNVALLTGANAAGKSTVLRMTCVAVIMAQIGCHVPCVSATLTPIDRIMTRLGANDNIMQGKSTFYVELSETKRMLDNATPRSLLVLDELGRGGSSSDGFAIAEAVLHHVATHIQSIGFFATHYGSLGSSFKLHPQVSPMRMAILVDQASRNITFLYKLEPGASNGSFGMHVASMCGVPKDIVDAAEVAAQELEHTSKLKKVKNQKLLSELPLGLQSDFSWLLNRDITPEVREYGEVVKKRALVSVLDIVDGL